MFSSISEFIVKVGSGIEDFSCSGPLNIRPAQAYGLSRADVAVETACGSVHVAYARTGGQQCAKVPEGRSELRQTMNEVADVELSCGENGGTIQKIDFASWGHPCEFVVHLSTLISLRWHLRLVCSQ